MSERDLDLEERVDRLLEDSGARGRSGASGRAERADADAELEALLERARAELCRGKGDEADWPPLREAALVGRVLARTTREDPGWRGELRLVAGFVRERVAGSTLLKVVAATLLLHVVAFPMAAAWVWWRSREQAPPRIVFDVPFEHDAPFADPVDEPAVLAPAEEPLSAIAAAEVENARARERFVLGTAALGLPPEGMPDSLRATAPASRETELLRARSRRLAERTRPEWIDDEEAWRDAGDLARVLWAEALLDDLALSGGRSPLLARALSALAIALDRPGEAGWTPELRTLARATLDRARALGAWPAPATFDPSARRTAPSPFRSAGLS